jgi:hypothetical protein
MRCGCRAHVHPIDAIMATLSQGPEIHIAGHWFAGTWVPTTQPEPVVRRFQSVTPRYQAVGA